MAIFFSQVLGVNAGSLSSKLRDTGFISIMTRGNGAIKDLDMIISTLGKQGDEKSAEKNIKKVATFMAFTASLFGALSYVIYYFSRPVPKDPNAKILNDAIYGLWLLP
ncbi:hypothetical protein [Bartonella tribocorum]|uniref:Uncharacterized protein n=2 Tax=Bartonella tribocorum TaxID=85701 RepID=A0A2M6UR02_9HYPH|nr:hypothetical protein [Bartonella tribocorum]PIT68620.1 hypothetical protein CEV08_07660 [Bartonella tribocorum]